MIAFAQEITWFVFESQLFNERIFSLHAFCFIKQFVSKNHDVLIPVVSSTIDIRKVELQSWIIKTMVYLNFSALCQHAVDTQ